MKFVKVVKGKVKLKVILAGCQWLKPVGSGGRDQEDRGSKPTLGK
jgi:hypothetical protein